MLVRKDVLTVAPFSYVTPTPTGRAQLVFELDEEKSVRAGAKRKNFTPFSSYHCRISLSMLKGGLSTTTAFFLYLNA